MTNWIKIEFTTQCEEDSRIYESEWITPVDTISTTKVKHLYAMDYNPNENAEKHRKKRIYQVPIIIGKDDNEQEERAIAMKQIQHQCDFYEKHNKWDE